MTTTDRTRLAAILGMLGSDQAGERAAAALQAEAFRKRHQLTWQDLISGHGPTVYVDRWREKVVETAVIVYRPLPLLRSIVELAAEPWPCFFFCTIAFLAAFATCQAVAHLFGY
jgi:hypothetical protein